MSKLRVTVWNEHYHETNTPAVSEIYPKGIHAAIADGLKEFDRELDVRTATLEQPDHGLSEAVLEATDVLMWWGHMRHGDVRDDIVDKVVRRVWDGMGFIALHSAHACKPFLRMMGTQCMLPWRVDGEKEILWVTDPSHPIARGIDARIDLENTEMYGEWFQVPAPDELVFISWFTRGEVFRSGCVWKRGKGKVFYFRPGHETFPIYHQPDIKKVLHNAVCYLASSVSPE
jgi:trehalose utilization protein